MSGERREQDFEYRLGRIREAARAAGRDPASIAVVCPIDASGAVSQQVAAARRWGSLGATHVTLGTRDSDFSSLAEHLAALRAFREAFEG